MQPKEPEVPSYTSGDEIQQELVKANERKVGLRQRVMALNREHQIGQTGQESMYVDEIFHSYSHYSVDYSHTSLAADDVSESNGNQLQDQDRTINLENGWEAFNELLR